MLRFRLLSAAILLTSIFTLIFLDAWWPLWDVPGLYLVPAALFFVGTTSLEFVGLANQRVPVRTNQIAIASCIVFLSATIPMFYAPIMGKPYPPDCPVGKLGLVLIAMLLCTGWFSLQLLRDFAAGSERCLEAWGIAALIPAYVGGGAAFWVFLRMFSDPGWSLWALVSIITVAKSADAGAYFVGKAWGRRKLCPTISPGKTIEGALGGLVIGMVVAILLFAWLLPSSMGEPLKIVRFAPAAFFGALLVVVGIIGDLVESVVKRVASAKDSGQLLPGLGGIWDVTDSLLPTAVVGYLGIVAQCVWSPS